MKCALVGYLSLLKGRRVAIKKSGFCFTYGCKVVVFVGSEYLVVSNPEFLISKPLFNVAQCCLCTLLVTQNAPFLPCAASIELLIRAGRYDLKIS